MTKRRSRKKTEPSWWWVEGLRKLSGVKVWYPLYCSKTEAGAQQIQRMCAGEARRMREGLATTKDASTLKGYREFRVVPDSEQGVRCSECTSNYLKRIKRDGKRLWKCLNCGHVWEREAFTELVHDTKTVSKAPTGPSKASNRPAKGVDAARRASGREKKPQKPVRSTRKGRKIR